LPAAKVSGYRSELLGGWNVVGSNRRVPRSVLRPSRSPAERTRILEMPVVGPPLLLTTNRPFPQNPTTVLRTREGTGTLEVLLDHQRRLLCPGFTSWNTMRISSPFRHRPINGRLPNRLDDPGDCSYLVIHGHNHGDDRWTRARYNLSLLGLVSNQQQASPISARTNSRASRSFGIALR